MATGMEGLIPGGNPGGNNIAMPSPGVGMTSPAIGASPSPFQAPFPGGTSMPGINFPANFPGGGYDLNALMGLSPSSNLSLAGISTPQYGAALSSGFQAAGFPKGVGTALGDFILSGAGFNPQIAQALLAALGPQISRGEASIMEQFSSMGLRGGSPAAIGLGDFESQAYLDAGQILSAVYEQSVQNYLTALLGGKAGQPSQSSFGSILGGLGNLAGGIADLGSVFKSGSGGGSSPAPTTSGGGDSQGGGVFA